MQNNCFLTGLLCLVGGLLIGFFVGVEHQKRQPYTVQPSLKIDVPGFQLERR